jgi:hypothetical protein
VKACSAPFLFIFLIDFLLLIRCAPQAEKQMFDAWDDITNFADPTENPRNTRNTGANQVP